MTFRRWLQEMWMRHREECYEWHTVPEKNLAEYFAKYKYWLKREYRHQQGENRGT
jgi:hypothetical protein